MIFSAVKYVFDSEMIFSAVRYIFGSELFYKLFPWKLNFYLSHCLKAVGLKAIVGSKNSDLVCLKCLNTK